MKIKIFLIIILNIIFTENITNNIEHKQNSLKVIDAEINKLENELKKQIKDQKGANKQLDTLIAQISRAKNNLKKQQNKETYQSLLINQANNMIDSLSKNVVNIKNEQDNTKLLIKKIDQKNKNITNQIVNLNDSLLIVNNNIDQTLDTLTQVKVNIKKIIQETITVTAPGDLEFIIESNSWDNYILNSVLYDMLIDEKKEKINQLLNLEKKMKEQYNQNLATQNKLIQNKKVLNQDLEDYKKTEIRLSNNLIQMQILLVEEELIYDKLISEYETINSELLNTQNIIKNLYDQKNDIKNIQKNINVEKERIKIALNAKKEARIKIENEIEKLLTVTSGFKGSNLLKSKNQLPWPIMGDLITKFGKNTSSKGVIFDYNFIEIVGNEVSYLVKQIDPTKPDKDLVKKFQRITMNLKREDVGYGVFGPQTTQMWKKYNEIRISDKQKMPIVAIHKGKIEEIKFLDPITGVLVIIRHNDNTFSTYSGQIDVIVKKGQIVSSEQQIGLIKQEDVLAFQLWVDSKIVNPQNWLEKK